jgi:hypothetical protein
MQKLPIATNNMDNKRKQLFIYKVQASGIFLGGGIAWLIYKSRNFFSAEENEAQWLVIAVMALPLSVAICISVLLVLVHRNKYLASACLNLLIEVHKGLIWILLVLIGSLFFSLLGGILFKIILDPSGQNSKFFYFICIKLFFWGGFIASAKIISITSFYLLKIVTKRVFYNKTDLFFESYNDFWEKLKDPNYGNSHCGQ